MSNPFRFDLGTALAAWRRALAHNRAFSADDLDELEQHLRDHVAALCAQGLDEEAAYRRALAEMGDCGTAEVEYRKVYWAKARHQRRLGEELTWRMAMIKNYVQTALRSLLRQKGYAFINLAGLTLGMTCCLVLLQYVAFEYSFDAFNTDAPQLYRITKETRQNDPTPNLSAFTEWKLGPTLADEVPEIARFTRIHPNYGDAVVSTTGATQNRKTFEEHTLLYVDPAFLSMFTYPLVTGDPEAALTQPRTLLLSETAARKYFGTLDAVGEMLDVTGFVRGSYTVAGVFRDVPAASHLKFDFLLPMADLLQSDQYADEESGWSWSNFSTYVQLHQHASPAAVGQKMTETVLKHQGDQYRQQGTTLHVAVQPLRDIHLNGDVAGPPQVVTTSRRTVYFFSLIAVITLLIALVNYVNLATARAVERAREVGVRKVVGAHRQQLVVQFLTESALTNLAALVLAATLAAALLPVVNQLAEVRLDSALWGTGWFWAALGAFFVLSTLLSGFYPAFVLSSFQPARVLKGKTGRAASGLALRKGLVVLQFAASILLVAGTYVVYTQLDYMRRMDVGLALDQILVIDRPRVVQEGADRSASMAAFKEELRALPAVQQVAVSHTVPGRGFSWYATMWRSTADAATGVQGHATGIDSSFNATYDVQLLAGRDFTQVAPTTDDALTPILVNEAAAQRLGFGTPEEALLQHVTMGGNDGFEIVGVVENFNWSSAHRPQEAILFYPSGSGDISVKVAPHDLPETLAAIQRTYETLFPGNPFDFAFLDDAFDAQYRGDERFATLFGVFAGLAIVIACLGLFGLATFAAGQRTKEIGVRKTLGASVPSIVALLSRDFVKLVGIAFVVAAPLAYVIMQQWLEGFAYRIEVGASVFAATGILVLLLALLTVSYQSIRAALADPVKSLRYE